MGFLPRSMDALLLILLLLTLSPKSTNSNLQSADAGFISAVVSEKGLNFVKDLLVEQAIQSLTPLRLPDIQKSVKIPLIGGVRFSASNITLYHINVSSSTIHPGDTGVAIVASGANASLSLEWRYSYNTWLLVPIEISDNGSAFVKVDGMQVGLTLSMKNKNGTLALNITQCGCYMEDITITLEGGASWFYQGFVNAFENQIRSAVENTITKKISEGTGKLDLFLQNLPKQIDIGDIAALNVTFVDDPMLGNSSIEFDVNGLFVPLSKVESYLLEKSQSPAYSFFCGDTLKMLGISVDEAVFDSASMVLFEEGLFHWIVDKVPDQSLLNTASWKFIIPKLYRKYPNDEMLLNISLGSAPIIRLTTKGFTATILSDMTVEVLDDGKKIPVACISVEFTISGAAYISGHKIVSEADLKDFSLSLKWSEIGNFRMFLIQGVMRIFLNTIVMPYVNSHLHRGFPMPVFHGLTLENAQILTSSSRMVLCSDLAFIDPNNITSYAL